MLSSLGGSIAWLRIPRRDHLVTSFSWAGDEERGLTLYSGTRFKVPYTVGRRQINQLTHKAGVISEAQVTPVGVVPAGDDSCVFLVT